MSVGPAEFREVLGRFATGVTVVTTCDGTQRSGITVNAFTSVSLDPPLVLICIERIAQIHDVLLHSGFFAVNILGTAQQSLSECFASRSRLRHDAFCDAASHTVTTGAPILDGAHAFVDCRTIAVYPGGDHSIFVGQVEALGSGGDMPLLYYRGTYRRAEETQP